ncbi:MAG: helix-hairpin-helix domain-containing protein [Burkholderiales bacterium]|nr:helix-hairpin-helix domain-containing protein [Burkholderiales bacterium]
MGTHTSTEERTTRARKSQASEAQIVSALRQAAELLHAQGANPFRVGAYRKAADTVEGLAGELVALYEAKGTAGLDALPGIGPGIAAAIGEMLETGRWSQLERLRGSVDPEMLFRTIPGVGAELARRIHEALHVDTLEELETAAHDGRLDGVEGVGKRRAASIRASLAEMLDRRRLARRSAPQAAATEPSVALLLEIDAEYREKAEADALPRIAPKRFNPKGEAWLPILHATRGAWHFTALFSNTARAHELGKTRDWVVIYFYDSDHVERQRTVVTEARGALGGRRVVRGREEECRRHYSSSRAQ